MKKIVLTLVAMLSMTMAFASNTENEMEAPKAAEVTSDNMSQNYDMRVNMRRLAVTLNLDAYQMDAVPVVYSQFVREMREAGEANSNDRKALVEQAAQKELSNMSYVLNSKQYDTFSTLLNVTLSNRGLLK